MKAWKRSSSSSRIKIFFASPAGASCITGHVRLVDGGWTAR
jgi:hypothetical protein